MPAVPYTVIEAYSVNRIVTAIRPDERLIDIPVPYYLPMPEIGSLVTIVDGAVVAVLTLPSQKEANDYLFDVPTAVPGDHIITVPDRGFIGFMKSMKSLLLGHALHSCFMEFGKDGVTLAAPTLNFLGTGVTCRLVTEDPFDAGSKVSLEFNMDHVVQASLSSDHLYLNVMDELFIADFGSKGVKASVMTNRATGERKELLDEAFAGEGGSSSANDTKNISMSGAVKATLSKTFTAVINDLVKISAKQLRMDVSESMRFHGNNATLSADKEVTIEGPTVNINATPGASPAGTVKISNGQMSSINMSAMGNVGIGATGYIMLGGLGEFAANGVVTTKVIANLATAVQIIAAACGGFPPTSGANGANAPLALVWSDLGQIINPVIMMTSGSCMPSHLPV